jgi:thiamine-monophosphate kinase
MISEFNLIQRYFKDISPNRADVLVGIGDDAAVISVPQGFELAMTVDTLVSGVHFFENVPPADLAHKALAVNLSDLAAMGGSCSWLTLALTLPNINEIWLQAFSDQFKYDLNRYNIALIGGDTTRGPLGITIQAMGLLPQGQRLARSGAKPGDLIYVTGTLGDAALAYQRLQQSDYELVEERDWTYLKSRLERPTARVEWGTALLNIASSCIDISDGLCADLGHILDQSQVGAIIEAEKIPYASAYLRHIDPEEKLAKALTFGDDYELCFTVNPKYQNRLHQLKALQPISITCIGEIRAEIGLKIINQDAQEIHFHSTGYQHF